MDATDHSYSGGELMPYHDLGDPVPITATIRDAAGEPVVPSTAMLTITRPDGTTTSPTITPAIPLQYDFLPASAGLHAFTLRTTGPDTEITGSFYVESSPRGLFGIPEVRQQLNLTAGQYDEELRLYIAAATDVIERHVGRAVVPRTVTETQEVCGATMWLNWTPVRSITSLTGTTGGALTGYTLDGALGRLTGLRYSGMATVVYVAGMVEIPANYRLAARIIVQHLWETKRGGATLSQPSFALEDSVTVSGMGYAVPNRALELLGPPAPMVA